jgi:hypothetical protein
MGSTIETSSKEKRLVYLPSPSPAHRPFPLGDMPCSEAELRNVQFRLRSWASVLRIRIRIRILIRRIHMFLSLTDPHPDPLVRDMDPDPDQAPDPDPSIIKQKQ